MNITIIDLETGGLDPHIHGITEICALKGTIKNVNSELQFHSESSMHRFIRPHAYWNYTLEALRVQNNTLDQLDVDGIHITDALIELVNFLGPDANPLSIWAQQEEFDHEFIRQVCLRGGHLGPTNLGSWVGNRSSFWNCSKRLIRLCRTLGLVDWPSDSMKDIWPLYSENRAFQGLYLVPDSSIKSLVDCYKQGHVIAHCLNTFAQRGISIE
jgi:hypothetical protein